MKAYNESSIRNQVIRQQAERWERQQLLSAQQVADIRQAYPINFRLSNFFLDTGLFIFTLVAAAGGFGLLALVVGPLVENSRLLTAAVCLTLSLGLSWATVTLTQKGTYYKNGVDNALILLTAAFLIAGIHLLLPPALPLWLNCLINLPILIGGVWYFGDTLLGIATLAMFYTLIFDGLLESSLGRVLLPFVLIGVSCLLYGGLHRLNAQPKDTMLYWTDALTLGEWIALLMLLASSNYLVVRQLNGFLMTPRRVMDAPEIALPGLFWLLTFGIPLAYGYFGLRHKTRILISLSVVGLAVAAATARYYTNFLSPTMLMLVGGAALIGLAVMGIHYLRTVKHGYTDAPDDDSPNEFWATAQTLALNQTPVSPQQPKGITFGEGDFGGGGAEGRY